MSTRPFRLPAVPCLPRLARALLCLGLVGCGAGEVPGELAALRGRPSDGLLTDAELQAVVDAQVRRDWQSLSPYLSHERDVVRARASLALASVQAPEAVPDLVRLLDDADVGVRRDAAFALGQSGQRDAVGPIFTALDLESHADVRHRLIEALGKLGFDEILPGLLSLDVSGTDEVDRLLAIARLGAIHGVVTEAGQNELMAMLDHDDPAVREAAAYYFGRLREPGHWSPRVARLRQALDGYGDSDPAAVHLVKALGRLKAAGDLDRLARFATSSPDWRVRTEAMVGLAGRELDEGAREALFAGLNDRSVHVAVNAANTLAGVTHLPSALGRLANWVEANPQRWRVAGLLLGILARHDEQEFVLAWIDALPPTAEDRLDIGLRALAGLGGEEARRRLAEATTAASDRIATTALGALRERWRTEGGDRRLLAAYFEDFSAAVESGRGPLVSAAAPGLADPAFGSFGNTRVLLDAMSAAPLPEGLPIVQAIVNSLGQTGDPAVAEVLRGALEHPYASVRRSAVRALGQHFGEEVEAPEGGLPDPDEHTAAGGPDPTRIDWSYLAGLGTSPRLLMETERGRLVVRMRTEEAPHTVQTVARLAQGGRFDGTPFHRVVPNFVIQGGDVAEGTGRGGPGFSITTEITGIPYRRGVIGMASAGRDTEGSQFFLVHSAQPHLDGQYTAFGWLLEGEEALDAVAQGDILLSARVEPGG